MIRDISSIIIPIYLGPKAVSFETIALEGSFLTPFSELKVHAFLQSGPPAFVSPSHNASFFFFPYSLYSRGKRTYTQVVSIVPIAKKIYRNCPSELSSSHSHTWEYSYCVQLQNQRIPFQAFSGAGGKREKRIPLQAENMRKTCSHVISLNCPKRLDCV